MSIINYCKYKSMLFSVLYYLLFLYIYTLFILEQIYENNETGKIRTKGKAEVLILCS